MGYQDRGYYRSGPGVGFGFAPEWSGVNTIIAITVGVWLANFIFTGDLFREFFSLRFSLNDLLCLKSDLPRHLGRFYTLLTYGFCHDGPSLELQGPYSLWHLIFNMLSLWFFGRPVEGILGKAEFLRFYCFAIVFAGIIWLVGEQTFGPVARLVGASGAVMAVLATFIWYYPREQVLIYGIFPVPAWALGVLYLVSDLQGTSNPHSHVAHLAHLAGAGFGFFYAWQRIDLSWITDGPGELLAAWKKRRLRIVRPDEPADDDPPAPLEQEVDRILEKISRSGEASLTPHERDALARASRRLKDRRG
jgi:membrane associated rhomboid family serine protease